MTATRCSYPVGLLIVVVLGGIAFDLSHVHMERRELIEVSGDVANDVATLGLDQRVFRTEERYALNPAQTDEAVERVLRSVRGGVDDVHLADLGPTTPNPSLTCGPNGPCVVRVTLDAHVQYLFGRALPGLHGQDLRVTSQATVED
jgi:hypothetical protein